MFTIRHEQVRWQRVDDDEPKRANLDGEMMGEFVVVGDDWWCPNPRYAGDGDDANNHRHSFLVQHDRLLGAERGICVDDATTGLLRMARSDDGSSEILSALVE